MHATQGWTGIVCLCADELAEPNCETAKSAVFGEISDFLRMEWSGMWYAIPLLIIMALCLISQKSPIPVNQEHCSTHAANLC